MGGFEIAGLKLSAAQVEQILYVLVGFILFILAVLIINFKTNQNFQKLV